MLRSFFYFFCQRICLEFPVEVPIDSAGTTKPKKGVEKSLTPLAQNETKLQVGAEGAAAVASHPKSPESPFKKKESRESPFQKKEPSESSPRNEGRIFFLFILYFSTANIFCYSINASLLTKVFCN